MSADSRVDGVGIGGLNGKGDAVDFGFVGLGSLKVLSGTLIGTGMKSPRPDVVVTMIVVIRLVVFGSVVVRTVVVEIIVVGGSVVGMNAVTVLEVIDGFVDDIDFVGEDIDDISVIGLVVFTVVVFIVVVFIVLVVKVVVSFRIDVVWSTDFSTVDGIVDCGVGFGIGFIFLSNVFTIVVEIIVELVVVVIVVLVSGNKLFSKFIVGLSFAESLSSIIVESVGETVVIDARVGSVVVGNTSAERASVVKDPFVEFTMDSVRWTPVVFGTVCVKSRDDICVVKVIDFGTAVVTIISACVDFIFVVGLRVVFTVVTFWVVTVVVIGESAVVVNIKASSSSSKVFGVVN